MIMISVIWVDFGCDFYDFGDLGSIWVVLSMISVIWGRFCDFGDLSWILVIWVVISVIWPGTKS